GRGDHGRNQAWAEVDTTTPTGGCRPRKAIFAAGSAWRNLRNCNVVLAAGASRARAWTVVLERGARGYCLVDDGCASWPFLSLAPRWRISAPASGGGDFPARSESDLPAGVPQWPLASVISQFRFRTLRRPPNFLRRRSA